MKSTSNRRPTLQIDQNPFKPIGRRSSGLFQMRSEMDLITPTSPKRRASHANLTKLFNKLGMGLSSIPIHKIKNEEMNLEQIMNYTKEELLEVILN